MTSPDSTRPARFVFVLPGGARVEGQVQGTGGPIARHVAVSRARLMVRRARAGRPLFELEPQPGHARCCNHGNASCFDAGRGCVDIDGAPCTEG